YAGGHPPNGGPELRIVRLQWWLQCQLHGIGCIAVGIMAKKTAAKRARVRAGAGKAKRKTTARLSAGRVRAFELMVAGLAPDVRPPLPGTLAAADLLSASDLGGRERRWVAALSSSARHLEALTTLVVDAVKTTARNFALRAEPFDAQALAQAAAASLAARAEAAGLACKIDLADDLPRRAVGDPGGPGGAGGKGVGDDVDVTRSVAVSV